jgi:hypothetical protein
MSLKAPGGTKDTAYNGCALDAAICRTRFYTACSLTHYSHRPHRDSGASSWFFHDISTSETSTSVASGASLGPVSTFMMMEPFVCLAASELSSISKVYDHSKNNDFALPSRKRKMPRSVQIRRDPLPLPKETPNGRSWDPYTCCIEASFYV